MRSNTQATALMNMYRRIHGPLAAGLLTTASSCICPSTICPLLGAELMIELPATEDPGSGGKEYTAEFRANYGGEEVSFNATVTLRPGEDGKLTVAEVSRSNDDDAYAIHVEVRAFAGDEGAPALYVRLSRSAEKEGIDAEFAPETVDVTVKDGATTVHDALLAVDAEVAEVRTDPGGASLCQYCEGSYTELTLE
jgi:hypothetical protein